MELNLETIAGVASVTVVVIGFLKKYIFSKYKLDQKLWYPALLNLVTILISVGLSCVTITFPGEHSIYTVLFNGLIGGLTAIGGYEQLINIIRQILGRKIG